MKYFGHEKKIEFYRWRFLFITTVLTLCFVGLVGRMIDLTIVDRVFLQKQGNARAVRIVSESAYRSMITDRQGKPLAISTPVYSAWLDPQEFQASEANLKQLRKWFGLTKSSAEALLQKNEKREFVYLKRALSPDLSTAIKKGGLDGIHLQKEYRRYYPDAAVSAHVLGFTNIDDQGQEGMELAYNSWLAGRPGKKVVVKDRMGHTVKEIDELSAQEPGHPLTLSIDQRIQFLAYQTLKDTVDTYKAKAGTAIVLDAKTGEVLAMVNQPDFDPNNKMPAVNGNYRNRAVTDMFEPGSVMKTFSMALALESGEYTPDTAVNIAPGWFYLGRDRVSDLHNEGDQLTLAQILQRSSNVGVAKVVLSLPAENLRAMFKKFGFERNTQSGFPGETDGYLVDYQRWPEIAVATLAFGYGVSISPLQLARAYMIIADGGIKYPISMTKLEHAPQGERVISEKVAQQVSKMLESVVATGGTGMRALVPGYRIAGKTGTARVAIAGGYDKHRHVGSFVGFAPASDPRLVVAVVIFEPTQKAYYGGTVAGPAFASIMGGALRILHIAPDDLGSFKHG